MTAVLAPRGESDDESVVVLRWLAEDGATVQLGQPIVVLEASKAAVEVEAPDSGRLQILAAERAIVRAGAKLGLIAGPRDEPAADGSSGIARVRGSRRAERLAAAHGIDLAELGLQGIVTEKQVRAALGSEPDPGATSRRRPLSPTQAVVARRARASLQSRAHAFVLGRYDARGSVEFLDSQLETGRLIPFFDVVVYHVARCLRDFPELNACLRGEVVEEYESVNVAFTVETRTTVYAPVVHGADRLSLGELTERMCARKLEVLRGAPRPESLAGGTFTVSGLDEEGLLFHLPIINDAQGAILGVGPWQREVVAASDGTASVTPRVGLCLSYDHAMLNGAAAARFLSAVGKRLATNPE